MVTLYIMCGLPFSGKSTLSKKIAERLGIKIISFDETWIEVEKKLGVVPDGGGVDQWEHINTECENKAREMLQSGMSVVYDNLGHDLAQRQHMRDLADDAGAVSELVYVNVDKGTVRKRREVNVISNVRAQVDNQIFNKAIEDFEEPNSGEMAIVYNPTDSVDEWIETNLKADYPYWHQTTVAKLESILKHGLLSPKAAIDKGISNFKPEFKSSWNQDSVSLMSNQNPRKSIAGYVSILVSDDIKTIEPVRAENDITRPNPSELLVSNSIPIEKFIGILIGEVGYSFKLQKSIKPHPVNSEKVIKIVTSSGLNLPIYFRGEQIWPEK